MLKIRVTTTGSNAKAVQAIRYQNNKRIVVKHFGSAHTDLQLEQLLEIANQWVVDYSLQLSFFDDKSPNNVLHINHCAFLGVYYSFFYQVIRDLQVQIGFGSLNQFLNDLVIVRILEPASKLRSIELLDTYFGIKHRRQNFYKMASKWLDLKKDIELKVVDFAKQTYQFNFDLLFYDVTTLYFETFDDDELRKQGFSKDNKSQQPQILIGLMVTKEGFPINYEVFSGNTFEGHTIVPVIQSFIKQHKVTNFTVIADAAMISSANIEEFQKNNINYIVGARLANLSNEIITTIDKNIIREDGKTIRIKIPNGYLICSFSTVRYRKDKYEMEKQIEKAKLIIQTPSKSKKTKFTQTKDEKIEINQKLIDKTTKLLGIKGYCTDLEQELINNQTIIERYHELYKIEQCFRISKSDLQTRPIFHFKEDPIKLHLLICFMALVIAKHIELKTGISIKRFITDLKKVTNARMLNKITNKEIQIRTNLEPKIIDYLMKLSVPH